MSYRILDADRGIVGPISRETLLHLFSAGVVDDDVMISEADGPFKARADLPELAAQTATDSDDLAPRVDIARTSVSQVLYRLHAEQASGVLAVVDQELRVEVFLRRGWLLFLSGKGPAERIGERLVRTGKLTAEQVDTALGEARAHEERLGDALIRLGFVSAAELSFTLTEQQVERLIELCCWTSGEATFHPDASEDEAMPALSLAVPDLILRATREMPEQMLAAGVDSENRQPVELVIDPADWDLSAGELKALIALSSDVSPAQRLEACTDPTERLDLLRVLYLGAVMAEGPAA